MSESFDEIIAAAREGDENAWRHIVESYTRRVFGLIFKHCQNAELAEEITQLTFVKIAQKLGDYEEDGKFDAWLFRIAVNHLRDEMRRQKRQARPTDFEIIPSYVSAYTNEEDPPDARMQAQEDNQQLDQAIAKLPDADQELIFMRYSSGLSYAEIAEALDQPLGTVLARGHRALKKLKDMLGQRS